jgi:hypothetical protein
MYLFSLLLLFGPRLVGVLWWLFEPVRWNAAFGTVLLNDYQPASSAHQTTAPGCCNRAGSVEGVSASSGRQAAGPSYTAPLSVQMIIQSGKLELQCQV